MRLRLAVAAGAATTFLATATTAFFAPLLFFTFLFAATDVFFRTFDALAAAMLDGTVALIVPQY